MQRRKIGFFLLCLLIMVSCAQGKPVFQDTQGHSVKLTKLKGQWVVVAYWADWCPSCIEDVPELNDFYRHTRHMPIVLYGVNYDGLSGDQLAKAVHKMRITFPVLTADPGSAWGLEEVHALPTIFIINPKGEVVKKIVGTTSERSLLENFVAKK